MSKQLRTISKTASIRLSDVRDHSMPRRLFQQIFNARLPQINILTKSQHKKAVSQQNTARLRRLAQRQQRMKRLQMPRKIKLISFSTPSNNTRSTSFQRTGKLSNTSYDPSTSSQLFIYKSEIRPPQSTEDPQNKPSATRTYESDESLQQPGFSKEIDIASSIKSSHRQKHLLDLKGHEAILLRRIFDVKGYDEKFEEINTGLLKKEKLYRSKEWRLETKQEWKL